MLERRSAFDAVRKGIGSDFAGSPIFARMDLHNKSGPQKQAAWHVPLFRNERKQGNLTRTLDRDGQLTLMIGTSTGHTAGQDLSTLGKVSAKLRSVFIIDMLNLIDTKSAYFSALTRTHIAAF